MSLDLIMSSRASAYFWTPKITPSDVLKTMLALDLFPFWEISTHQCDKQVYTYTARHIHNQEQLAELYYIWYCQYASISPKEAYVALLIFILSSKIPCGLGQGCMTEPRWPHEINGYMGNWMRVSAANPPGYIMLGFISGYISTYWAL